MKFKRPICQPVPLSCVWVIDKKTKNELQLMFLSSVLSISVSIIIPLSSMYVIVIAATMAKNPFLCLPNWTWHFITVSQRWVVEIIESRNMLTYNSEWLLNLMVEVYIPSKAMGNFFIVNLYV
jgi:hypothetical protein